MSALTDLRHLNARVQVVHDVVAPNLRAMTLSRLQQLPTTRLAAPDSPLAGIRQWGCMIGPTPLAPRGPEQQRYAQHNGALWAGLEALAPVLESAIVGALQALSDTPVHVAPGRHIASARCMPDGLGAPRHIDRYPDTAAYAPLRARCVLDEQLVWYLMLQDSPRGGALRVYPGEHPVDQGPPDHAPYDEFLAPAGALLVHPAARVWHEVRPPLGGDRITLGGICAPLRDGSGWWACA